MWLGTVELAGPAVPPLLAGTVGGGVALLALGLLGAGALGRRGLLLRAPPPETAPQSDAPVT